MTFGGVDELMGPIPDRSGGTNHGKKKPAAAGAGGRVGRIIQYQQELRSNMTTTEGDSIRLRQLVTDLTVELMSWGGTTPKETCEIIAEDAPDLWTQFGAEHIFALVGAVQYSELPAESARLQEAFRTFNDQYFAGRLPKYIVCVVYDVAFWDGRRGGESDSGFVDFDRQLITIGYTGEDSERSMLLFHMAHAVNPQGTYWDDAWREEIRRLLALGAPVEFVELG
jgi:hypothetical protein